MLFIVFALWMFHFFRHFSWKLIEKFNWKTWTRILNECIRCMLNRWMLLLWSTNIWFCFSFHVPPVSFAKINENHFFSLCSLILFRCFSITKAPNSRRETANMFNVQIFECSYCSTKWSSTVAQVQFDKKTVDSALWSVNNIL